MKDEDKTKEQLIKELETSQTQRKRAEEALRERTHSLGKRVKELNCLCGIATLAEKHDISLEEIFQGIVDLIPPAWQYPEVTCARIILENQEFRTNNFKETNWKQASDIVVHGDRIGTLEVCYLEQKPGMDEGPFLKEERNLIKAIAKQLANTIERKRAEEALRESEKRYRALFENLNDAAFLADTETGHILDTNKQGEVLVARTRDEIIGMHQTELHPPGMANQYRQRFATHVQKGRAADYDGEAVRKDGSIVPVNISAAPVTIGGKRLILGLFRDITERKRAEEALRESEKRYRDLADLLPQTVFELDERANLIFVNRNALDMFRYSQEDFDKGLSAIQMFIPEDRDRAKENIQKRLRGEKPGINEYTALRKDGNTFPVLVHSAPIIHEGKPIGLRGIIVDITDRKQAEEGLRASEQKLRLTFESIVEGVAVTDLQANFTQVNEAAVHLYGYDNKEEMIGCSLFKLIAEKDRDRAMEQMKGTLEVGYIKNVDYTFLRKDGSEFDAELSMAVLRDASGNPIGFVGITSDIAKRRQAEEALQQSEEKLRIMFDSCPEGITLSDLDTKVLNMNETALRMHGFSRKEELIGRSLLDFIAEKDRVRVIENLKKTYREGYSGIVEYTFLTKDGEEFDAELSAAVLRDGSASPVGFIIAARDVTERKRLERKMVEYQELNKMKSNLLSTVSHELRTPLATIKGYSSMLLDYDRRLSSEEKREYLSSIDRATDALTELVDHLLDMSRLEAGLLKLEKTPASISKLIKGAVTEAGLRAPKHKIVLNLPKRLPRVNIDAKRIRQVLDNIIDNAIKYSSEGTEVAVSAKWVGRELLVSIADQGIGIPAEDLERVFDPMYRIEQRLTWGIGGVGLGLAICKGLVDAHGGHIWMESEEGKGSTCSFTLPL